MSESATVAGSRRSRALPSGWARRLLAAGVSLAALTYVAGYLAVALQTNHLRVVSDKVLAGEAFTDDFVSQVATATRQFGHDFRCGQASSEELATLTVFAAGAASTQAPPAGGVTLADARRYLRSAIQCSPSKPFLWFLLFWVESRTDLQSAMAFLDMSYRLGPNEGWLAPARTKAAMPVLEQAPPRIRDAVLSEYRRLVAEDFETSLGLFMMADQAARTQMSQALSTVPAPIRAEFTRRLDAVDIKLGPSD